MISRNTWILLGVLVVLVGVGFFIPWYQGRQPKPTPAATTAAPAQVFAGAQVDQFTVQSKDGKKVVVKGAADGTWKVIDPTNLAYDASTVASAAQYFTSALVQTELPTQPPADVMGIAAPEYVITVQMSGGAQKVMNVGNATPTGDGYYVQVDRNPAFTVSKSDLSSLLDLLTAGQPLQTPTAPAQDTSIPQATEISPTLSIPVGSPTAQ